MHRKISLFLRTRINDPFRSLLHQGLAPDQLARGFACGLTLGILPLPWGITPLCVLVAWRLGLNQAVVQAGNWLAWPLQLLLFVPFMRIGEYLLPFGPPLDLSLLTTEALLSQSAALLGWILVADLKALVGWALVSWAFYLLSAAVALPLFCRLKTRRVPCS
ncbi:MAG: DUF2062 domain-containing protein [Deltaproteobacteria bacterium]|jgi:uncharacterized protein (DUF2062 family)|nr:DUF2062 domain-containing protein [Deltaproteobacteria bacterium]